MGFSATTVAEKAAANQGRDDGIRHDTGNNENSSSGLTVRVLRHVAQNLHPLILQSAT